MIRDKLMINDSKIEFILIGTRQQSCKLQTCALSIGQDTINARTQVKTLVNGWTRILTCLNMLIAFANQLFSIFITYGV